MDLADILSREAAPGNLQFFHVGWQELAGVFDDKPYPIIWIKDDETQVIPPWENDEARTKVFLSEDAAISKIKLQQLITSVRNSLPHLRLFSPYFSVEKMPSHHKTVMASYLKKSEDEVDPLDVFERTEEVSDINGSVLSV